AGGSLNAFSPTSRGLADVAARIADVLGARSLAQSVAFEEITVTVAAHAIVEVVTALRDDPQLRFVSFIDICGVDWPQREKRFDVVYHFLSPATNHRVRIKLETDADTPVPSIS